MSALLLRVGAVVTKRTKPFLHFAGSKHWVARKFSTMAENRMFALDPFCLRQFKDPANVAHISQDPEEFMDKLEAACQAAVAAAPDGNILCVLSSLSFIEYWIDAVLTDHVFIQAQRIRPVL